MVKLIDAVEAVKDGLKGVGASKFAVHEEVTCVIIETPLKDDVVVAAVFEGSKANYVVKLTLASKLTESGGISCLGIQYSPYGLFVISDSLNELREYVRTKTEAIIRTYSVKS